MLRVAFDMLLSRGHDNVVQALSDVFHAHRTVSQNSEARPGARLSRTCSLPRPRQRRLPRYPWCLLAGWGILVRNLWREGVLSLTIVRVRPLIALCSGNVVLGVNVGFASDTAVLVI